MADQRTITTYNANTSSQADNYNELAVIISELQKVRRQTGLAVSDDLLLDAAIRLHITAQINRQRPSGGMSGKRPQQQGQSSGQQRQMSREESEEAMATEKQLKYLRSLGASVPDRISKAKASQIIEELKQKDGQAPRDRER